MRELVGTFALVGVLFLIAGDTWAGQAHPVVKDGPCPSGYVQSNRYCVPIGDAGQAIAKDGPCPVGYVQSNRYCVAVDKRTTAIPKSGPCPSGYRQSNNYCVAN